MCVIAKPTRYKIFSCYNIEGKKEFTFIQNQDKFDTRERKKKKETKWSFIQRHKHQVEESIETPLYK